MDYLNFNVSIDEIAAGIFQNELHREILVELGRLYGLNNALQHCQDFEGMSVDDRAALVSLNEFISHILANAE